MKPHLDQILSESETAKTQAKEFLRLDNAPLVPGAMTRPVVDPEMTREVALVAISRRRFSPAVAAFVKAIRAYSWPGSQR